MCYTKKESSDYMKYCIFCGHKLIGDEDVCLECGCLVKKGIVAKDISEANSCATAGFIISFFNLLSWLIPIIGMPMSICGITYSAKGLKSQEKKEYAIIGLSFSLLYLILTLLNIYFSR